MFIKNISEECADNIQTKRRLRHIFASIANEMKYFKTQQSTNKNIIVKIQRENKYFIQKTGFIRLNLFT